MYEDISIIKRAQSRSLSPENPTGEPGCGATSVDGPGAAAARDLGSGWKISPFVRVAPDDSLQIADIEGPGRIQSIWITGTTSRDIILRMHWDRQDVPSVEVPLCDFFGHGWVDMESKIRMPYARIDSAMMAVNPSLGFNSYWPMPFREHCKITLQNRGEKLAQFYYQINYELCELPAEIACFHAQFRRVNPVPYAQEYVALSGINGCGQFAGLMLHAGMNGPNLWWGEGEVKFFLDGDQHPTICYTGTEDYFGGAWGWEVNGRYQPYTAQYCGVHFIHEPTGLEDMQQRFAMYRWHIPDPVRFTSNIKVTIQDLGWRRNGKYYLARQDDFATVAYWYQTLPTAPFPRLPDRNAMEVI